jgi:hypothetical protein
MFDTVLAPELDAYEDLLLSPDLASYQDVLELLVVELAAERGCLWLEREAELLHCGDPELHKAFPFSRQVVDSVLDQGCSFCSYDTAMDERLRPSGSIKVNKVRSCICAACYEESGDLLVIAYFDNSMNSKPFSEADLHTLRQVLSLVPDAMPVLA